MKTMVPTGRLCPGTVRQVRYFIHVRTNNDDNDDDMVASAKKIYDRQRTIRYPGEPWTPVGPDYLSSHILICSGFCQLGSVAVSLCLFMAITNDSELADFITSLRSFLACVSFGINQLKMGHMEI